MKKHQIHPKGELEEHPIAGIFPMMDKNEQKELIDSVKEHGVREEIVLFEGKVLDGRNRYYAAIETESKPMFRNFNPTTDGASAVKFVMDHNLRRRHMSASQRAAAAAAAIPLLEVEAKQRQQATQFKGTPGAAAAAPKGNTGGGSGAAATAPASGGGGHTGGGSAPAADTGKKTTAAGKTKKGKSEKAAAKGKVADEVAERFGVSATMVKLANKLRKQEPDLYEKVIKGDLAVNAAMKEFETRKAAKKDTALSDKQKAERVIAIGNIERRYGEDSEIFKAAKRKKILKEHKDLVAFSELNKPEGVPLVPLLIQGWTVAKASRFVAGELDVDNSITDLLNMAAAKGKGDDKKFTVKFGDWKVTVEQ